MSLRRSLGWGLVLTLVATVVTVVTGFVAGAGFSVPGVAEMSSSSSGAPATELFFVNPLAPLALAGLLGLVIWSVSRARGSQADD